MPIYSKINSDKIHDDKEEIEVGLASLGKFLLTLLLAFCVPNPEK